MNDRARSTEQAYNSAAVDFANRTAERSQMAAQFFDRFVASLPANALVADLGCGPGHDLARLSAAGHLPIGLDRATGLLELCPTHSMRVRGDLSAVPIGSSALDGVWSSAALLHVDRAQLDATLVEWARIVRPGGVLAFATSLGGDEGWELVPAGPARRPEIAPGEQRWFAHHEPEALTTAVARAGFVIEWSTVRSSHRDWLQVLARK